MTKKRTWKKLKSFKKKTIKFKVSHQDFKKLSKFKDKSIQQAIKNKEINTKKGFTLKINKFVNQFSFTTSNFLNYVYNSELVKLHNYLNKNKCVNNNSLYSQCETVIKDGWVFKVLKKNQIIYKTMPGFITEKNENNYLKNNNNPSWFGDKYIVYNIASYIFGGINAYKVINDIYLIDMFNDTNMIKLISLLKKRKDNKNLYDFNIHIGYNKSVYERLKTYYNIKKYKWDEIYLYLTVQFLFYGSSYNCNIKKNKNINSPFVDIKYNYNVYINLLKKIITDTKVDGIIIEQLQSHLDTNGVYKHEEIILKNITQINKIKRDVNNKLDWLNWNFKNVDISKSKGFQLSASINNRSNENFALINFYNKNKLKLPIINNNNKNYIFSYNIHGYKNINLEIDNEKNINNIINLIKKFNKNINYLIFQEKNINNVFNNKLIKLNFKYIYETENGSPKKDSFVSIASKNKLNTKIVNHKDSKNTYRNSILFTDSDFTGCAVHLTIGDRYNIDTPEFKDDNLKIKKHNYKERTNQLRGIIKHKPDFIIGDFNFTPEDDETDFLLKNGYNMVTPKTGNTTPYNRVDMCFLHKDSIVKFKNYKNIQCNYSDHLPFMLQIE